MFQLVLAARRDELLRMRDDGESADEPMNGIFRGLCLEESLLKI
jgi:hypothetical protein